jgi:hypothetical protein
MRTTTFSIRRFTARRPLVRARTVGVVAITAAVSLASIGVASAALNSRRFQSDTDLGSSFLVEANGTIGSILAPSAKPHTTVDTPGIDGYIICNGTKNYSQFSVFTSSDFGDPTTSGTNPFQSERTTSDGQFRLVQSFSFDGPAKRVTVKMTITNLASTTAPDVQIRRISELSPDEDSTDGFESFGRSQWLRTSDSVEAWNDLGTSGGKATHGVLLTHVSATGDAQPQTAVTDDISDCGTQSAFGTPIIAPTDTHASLAYDLGALGTKKSASVTMAYQVV